MDIGGGWTVLYDGSIDKALGALSNNFEHDVVLRVDGDFMSAEHRKEYCEALVDKLNGSPELMSKKTTRTHIPEGVSSIRNAATGEIKIKCNLCEKFAPKEHDCPGH